MPNLPPRCASFFESDPEYSDLNGGELAAKRYLRLIYSADYRAKPFIYDDLDKIPDRTSSRSSANCPPLPINVITIGRRLTPYLRIKILSALAVHPTKTLIRCYQLFAEVKKLGFRYDYKTNLWEFRPTWNNKKLTKNSQPSKS